MRNTVIPLEKRVHSPPLTYIKVDVDLEDTKCIPRQNLTSDTLLRSTRQHDGDPACEHNCVA